jgi:hypothetical protein
MQKTIILISLAILIAFPIIGWAGHDDHNQPSQDDHPSMQADTYKHEVTKDGIRAEFQIMSLASMKMKDESGATHHIMVKLIDETSKHQIKTALGKIKVINPDKTEQTKALKDYSGIMAASVTFEAMGKYGVICLVKIDDKKHMFKFWYSHKM